MGFIFQQMYMMKNLTIFDNIVLPAAESKKVKGKQAGKSRKEASSLCAKWESSISQITISTRFPVDSFSGRVSV